MPDVTLDIIDYGGGNLGSLCRAFERLGIDYQRVGAQQMPTGKNPLVLPGVGAFGAVIQQLEATGLAALLKTLVEAGTPYLGICVGCQVLFNGSEESPEAQGLGLLEGYVRRFKAGTGETLLKIPQIGWNQVESKQPELFPTGDVYFVNSYYPEPDSPEAVLYTADYGQAFCAAVRWQNITAFQFHPEKSGPFGQLLLQRWLKTL